MLFPEKNADYVYDYARSRNEAESILIGEIEKCDNFVLAAVKGDFGNKTNTLYKYAVFISVPKQIRLQRVRDRSFQKFGNRMLPDGDLYEKEKRFFDMVALRTEQDVEEWLHSINCCIIRVDGTKPIEENIKILIHRIQR